MTRYISNTFTVLSLLLLVTVGLWVDSQRYDLPHD